MKQTILKHDDYCLEVEVGEVDKYGLVNLSFWSTWPNVRNKENLYPHKMFDIHMKPEELKALGEALIGGKA
jgi:hypothetical protein